MFEILLPYCFVFHITTSPFLHVMEQQKLFLNYGYTNMIF